MYCLSALSQKRAKVFQNLLLSFFYSSGCVKCIVRNVSAKRTVYKLCKNDNDKRYVNETSVATQKNERGCIICRSAMNWHFRITLIPNDPVPQQMLIESRRLKRCFVSCGASSLISNSVSGTTNSNLSRACDNKVAFMFFFFSKNCATSSISPFNWTYLCGM